MSALLNVFFDPVTNRLRAGWRLLIQIIFLIMMQLPLAFIRTYAGLNHEIYKLADALLGFTASIWVAGVLLDRRRFSEFGLQVNKAAIRDFAAGWVIALVMLCFIGAAYEFSGTLPDGTWVPQTERLSLAPFWLLFAAMLMVGFYEELWSRGYHMLNLTEGLTGGRVKPERGALYGILVSSVIFGLLHAANPNATFFSIVNITLAGVWLALPYLVTGSLWLSIGLHAAWNFIMGGVFGLPISGQDKTAEAALFTLKPAGPEWFTGGAFGPEGGVAGVLALLLGTVLLLLYFKITGIQVRLHERFSSWHRHRESLLNPVSGENAAE
jgi:membrane protease YdiL (CAAX protease family)